jgi:hypothetical protein
MNNRLIQPHQVKRTFSNDDVSDDDELNYSSFIEHLPINLKDVRIVRKDAGRNGKRSLPSKNNPQPATDLDIIFTPNKITSNTVFSNEIVDFSAQQAAFMAAKLFAGTSQPPLLNAPDDVNPWSFTWMNGVLNGYRYYDAEMRSQLSFLRLQKET